MPGEPTELAIASRRALLDALEALRDQLDALVLVGAQAVDIHTAPIDEPIATQTKDGDLVVDPLRLAADPRIDAALAAAGFHRNVSSGQPGGWLSSDGIPVDLLVPAGVAPGNPKRRGVDMPPHDRRATRRTPGLEAALVDREPRDIAALGSGDARSFTLAVAGPAALLVAKLQKISERMTQPERRHVAKDGHDAYRLLRDVPAEEFVERFERLLVEDVSAGGAHAAVDQLRALFGGPDAYGVALAAAHISGVGDPETVTAGCVALADDLLLALAAHAR
jgi:hypothetical protein